MGRQAYLTRLALGRSPFGEALRDEQGNLFIGPHAHDDAGKDYIQQYDEKGRPINHDTEIVNRKLRRAQNEVLNVAGVVRKKEHSLVHSTLKTSTDDKEVNRLGPEDMYGFFLSSASILMQPCCNWWLHGVRHRIYVYKSNLEPRFLSMVWSEIKAFGLSSLFVSGLFWNVPAVCASAALRRFYSWPRRPSREILLRPRSHTLSLLELLSLHAQDVLGYAIEWPLRAFATLQSLQLIPLGAFPDWREFLPWTSQSATRIHQLRQQLSDGDIAGFLVSFVVNPMVFAYLCDILRESLQTGLRGAILNCATRPEEPGDLSIAACVQHCASDECESGSERLMFLGRAVGIPPAECRASISGWGLTLRRRYRGPRRIFAALSFAFPVLFDTLGHIPAVRQRLLRPKVNQRLLDKVIRVCNQRYNLLFGLHSDLNNITDDMIREEAVLQGWRLSGVDAIDASVDIQEFAKRLVKDDDDEVASTATPDTLSAIEEAFGSETEAQMSENSPQLSQSHITLPVSQDNGAETSQMLPTDIPPAPTLPERELSDIFIPEAEQHESVNHMDHVPLPVPTLLGTSDSELLANGSQLPRPMTPTPGISRARSLPLELPAVPVRRPTEVDESIGHLAENLRRASSTDVDPAEPRAVHTYRVTHMSLLAIDTFALMASNLVTSLLMLPLDIYYTRLLARSFLSAAPRNNNGAGAEMILRDIWPMSPWLGFREMGSSGSLKFVSRVFLTFGMQSVLSVIVWKGTAWWTLREGRRRFGWRSL